LSQIAKECTTLIVLAITALSANLAAAGYIPLLGGYFEYEEILDYTTYEPEGIVSGSVTGTDPRIAERITASAIAVEGTAAGTASGYAETTAGSPGAGAVGPTAPMATLFSDYVPVGNQSAAAISGLAAVRYEIQLVKLHPDAPDIAIPLLFTSTLSGSFSSLSVMGSGVGYQQQNSAGGVENVDAGLFVQPGDKLLVQAEVSTGSDLGLISATAPVFAIDPAVQVSFIPNPDGSPRFVPATDLYTLIYPAAIGYAGSFNTVTPLTEGCLPDPSILAPNGLPSVTDGQAISCQALDPSGFRSYGSGALDPRGVLNNLSIVITPDAIVRTDEAGKETIGLLGNGNTIFNEGTILSTGDGASAVSFAGGNDNSVDNFGAIDATGLESLAVEAEGDGVEVYSTGAISTSGDYSAAVYLEGDEVSVLNEGVITTDGQMSSAVVLEGDDAGAQNAGEIQTSRDASSGLVIEGIAGFLDNSGSIATQGVFSAGMVMLGYNSTGIENTGSITTTGDDAMGILALGLNHAVSNLDATGQIWTLGARAHGIALGLQDPVLPVGVEIPPAALAPASGSISNSGRITTQGDEADAIHALADDLPVLNTGELTTRGRQAHAISVAGDRANIENSSMVTTEGEDALGISVVGADAVVNNNGRIYLASIATAGLSADAIDVAGDRATVTNTGDISTTGLFAYAVSILGDTAKVLHGDDANPASITTSGDLANGINVLGDHATVKIDGGALGATILTQGSDADAISISGNQARVEIKTNGIVTTEGDNARAIRILGDSISTATISNAGLLIAGLAGPGGISPTRDAGGIELTGRGNITIETDGILNVFGEGAQGIRNVSGDDSVIVNLGIVEVDSSINPAAGGGIYVQGDNVRVQNGARQASTAPDNARLLMKGDNSEAIRTAGTGAAVSNGAELTLDGTNNTAIAVEMVGDASYWVDNDGTISLGSGANNFGIHVYNNNPGSNLDPGAAVNGEAFCVVGGPSGAQVLNCGTIDLGTSDNGAGMLVQGTAGSFIENQDRITGHGSNQVAMRVSAAAGADPGDAQVNVITNFTDIDLQSPGVRGMLVEGSGNFVFNGTGESRIDFVGVARFDDSLQDLGGSISQGLDKLNTENQATTSLAHLMVDGVNAVGIDINGIGNLVGNRLDLIDTGGEIVDPALPPELQPGFVGFSEIIARNTGSVGVRFSGEGNVLDNQGIIEGGAYSVLGGSGNDIVQNKHRLIGNVDLGDGDDTFIQVGPGSNIAGTVDAGENGGRDDLLFVASTAPVALEQNGTVDRFVLDGNQFRNFEDLKINNGDLEKGTPGAIPLPQGRAYLRNTLDLDAADSGSVAISLADIRDATLYFENGARLEADVITVGVGGALRGNGSAGRQVIQIGQVDSTIIVDPGGLIGPGNSAGEFEIFGDLTLGGTLEFEIGGTETGKFDILRVLGDLDLLETASLDIFFTDGFAPQAGDRFEFLSAENLPGDLDLVEVSIFGLLPGFEYDFSLDQGNLSLVALTNGVVPLPPALYLFTSALVLLATAGRRRR